MFGDDEVRLRSKASLTAGIRKYRTPSPSVNSRNEISVKTGSRPLNPPMATTGMLSAMNVAASRALTVAIVNSVPVAPLLAMYERILRDTDSSIVSRPMRP